MSIVLLLASALTWVALIRTAVSRPDDAFTYLIRFLIAILTIFLFGEYLGDPL